jgi:uncharacterized membrane protein YhhN
MTEAAGLGAAAALCALVYGLVLVERPVSPLRTAIKTAATALLAILAYRAGGPAPLIAALALCALGDTFLAGDPKRWLPFGLGAFLVGHLVYVWLFAGLAGPLQPVFWIVAPPMVIGAAAMLVWLRPSLGALRPAVMAYVAAIVAMVCASLLPPWPRFWPVTVGALAFMASDALLAADLFKTVKLAGSPRLTAWAVWFLYFGGQALICWGFVGRG